MPNTLANRFSWDCLPDSILLSFFTHLPVKSLLYASQTCSNWYRVAGDQFVWRKKFCSHWKLLYGKTSLPPGKKIIKIYVTMKF